MGGQPGRAAPRSLTGEPGGWPPGTVPEKETDEWAKVLLRVAELYKERSDGLVALITTGAGFNASGIADAVLAVVAPAVGGGQVR